MMIEDLLSVASKPRSTLARMRNRAKLWAEKQDDGQWKCQLCRRICEGRPSVVLVKVSSRSKIRYTCFACATTVTLFVDGLESNSDRSRLVVSKEGWDD